MAYEPLIGWIQVTKRRSTGELQGLRFHADRACAQRSIESRIAKGIRQDKPVTGHLSRSTLYGQARLRYKVLTTCKCTGHIPHVHGPDRPPRERPGAAQGTGRRR